VPDAYVQLVLAMFVETAELAPGATHHCPLPPRKN
jgi:hypothetical protein